MRQYLLAIIAVLTAIIFALFTIDTEQVQTRTHVAYQRVYQPVTENMAVSVVETCHGASLQGRETMPKNTTPESMSPETHGRASLQNFAFLHHAAMMELSPAEIPPLDAGMVNVTGGFDGNGQTAGYRVNPRPGEFAIAVPYNPSLLPQGFTEDDIQTYVYDRQYHRWIAIQRDSVNEAELLVCSRFRPWEKRLPHTQNDLANPQDALAQVQDMMLFAPQGEGGGDSPLDFINAVLKTPEMPETSAYTPTSIKELKAADPLEGLTLMQPPTANNSGTANLSYSIEIPAGRQGMQPNLALTYSSGGGNGWLGVGWDISIPSITVETRWGVPRYDQSKESETYLLNGEQLATKDSVGKYEDLPHRAAWKQRYGDGKQFYPRVEGAFQRIIRHGTTPKSYWWEVRDKQGIVYYYGKKIGQDSFDPESVLRDNSDNIAQWMLTEVRDLSGNYVRYEYQTIKQCGGRSAPHNIYPKEIRYTLHEQADTNYYSINFHLMENTFNPTDDGRYGFLRTNDKLLEAIVIMLCSSDTISTRIKAYTFCYDVGKYNKALLKNFGQIIYTPETNHSHTYAFCGSPGNLVTHEFDYYVPDDSTMFNGSIDTISVEEDKGSYRDLLPFRIKPSPLGGTYSNSWSVGGALTLGFGYIPASKNLTVGGNYMYAKTTSESAVTFADIDGDGLPDKVSVDKKGNILYRRMLPSGNSYAFSNEADTIRADVKKGLLNSVDETHDWGLEAHVKFGPVGASVAYSRSSNTSATTTYLCDMDGDGLPDLVSDGNVYYNRLDSQTGLRKFTLVTSDTVWVGGSCEKNCVFQDESVDENMFLPGDTVITVWYEKVKVNDTIDCRPCFEYIEHSDTLITQARRDSTPDFDAVRMWIAPYSGRVNLNSYACLTENLQTARFASHVTDGVRVSIQKNDGDIYEWKTIYPDAENEEENRCWNYSQEGIAVTRGDRFYFRVESLDKRNYDKVSWNPTFTYTRISQYGDIYQTDLKDADGMPIYRFSPKKDFLINAYRKYYIALDSTSVVNIERSLKIARRLSDTITLRTLRNNLDVAVPVVLPSGTVGNITLPTIPLAVQKNDSLFFEISSPTNVSWRDLDWTVGYHYISATDTNVTVWGQVNDTIPEPLIRYDTLTPHLTTYPKPVLPTFVFRSERTYNLRGQKIVLSFPSLPIHNTKATLSIKNDNGIYHRETVVFQSDGVALISEGCILAPGETYFVDLYSSDYAILSEAQYGFIDYQGEEKLLIGLHVAHEPDMSIFGPLYQNWGQFAYQRDSTEVKIIQNNLEISDEALTPYDTSMTDTTQYSAPETMSADSLIATMDGLCYDPAIDHFQIAEPDYKKKRWLGYGNLVFFSKDTMSNTYSSDPDTIDVTLFPVPYLSPHETAKVVNKSMQTKNNTINVQAGLDIPIENNASMESIPLSISGSFHWGHSDALSEFTDMNGDGYPDVVTDAQVQYSKPQGGLSNLKCGFHTTRGDNSFETTKFKGGGASFGGSFTHTTKLPYNSAKNVQHSLGGSAGINCSGGISNDNATTQWADLNGDGLPDRLVQTKEDTAVYYNLGYSYLKYTPQDAIPVRQGYSSNQGLSQSADAFYCFEHNVPHATNVNFNLFETSLSGGSSFQHVATYGISALSDLNGDGLPDIVAGGEDGFSISYNTGRGFLSPSLIPVDVYKGLNRTETWGRDLNIALSVGFMIGSFPVKFVINPQTDFNHKMNNTKSCFTDMNGDGLPDYVVEKDTKTIIVHYNQSGKANLLKSVTNLAGGSMTMDYELSKHMGYDCPSRHLVLSSLTVSDGHSGDGVDTQRISFEYDSAYYDRFERTSYGFGVVKTHSLDEDYSIYRTVTERYSNRAYKFRNLKTYELLTDGEGNKYVEKFFTYVPKTIDSGIVVNENFEFCYGESYPAINQEEVRYYEGENTAMVVTRKHYEHGPFGNLTKYTDAGQIGVAEDSIIVTMTYHADSAGKNLTGMVESVVAKNYQDSLLRKKGCTVNYGTGQIRQLKMYNDHDTAVTDFEYDSYGNLVQVKGPANSDGQRVTHRYTYDGTLHTYPVAVRNVPFGYVSTADYDFRIGKPLFTTDANGNTLYYAYDWSGRLTSLRAPGEPLWTIAHEYWIHYSALNEIEYVTSDSFPWARTRHYDIQHGNNTLNTTVIVDGLGRVVQTKKDAEIQGQEKSLISGKVTYDAFGRPVTQHYPFTDSSLDTLFKIDPQPAEASTTRYDILDRPVRVTQPYGIVTTMRYGFGMFGNHSCFRAETTDPLENVVTVLTDARRLTLEQTVDDTITTTFDYDALGQLLRSTDPDGLITSYLYDKFGQLTRRIHPDAGTEFYEYDAMGNMTNHTNGDNKTIRYHYDYNRLTDVEYPDYPANNVHYTYGDSTAGYNGKGRIVMQEDGGGWQTFKYGKLGELTENIRTFALPFESQTYTLKMEYEYDPFNRIQSILYPDSELVEYSYNLGGMLSKVTGSVTRKVTDLVGPMQMHGGSLLPGGNELMGGGAVSGDISGNDPFFIPTETIRYSYIDSIVYNKFELKDSVIYGNGTRVRYVYDSLQRLTALRSYTADDELMQDIAYHYDSVGNILDIENSAAALGNGLGGTYRQEYTYDNLYRLTHATGWWECRPDHLTLRDTVDMRYSKNGRIIRKQEYAETFKNSLLNLVRYDRQYQYSSPYSNKLGSVTDAMSGASHQFEWESGGNLMRHMNPDQNYDRRLWWTEDNRLQFVKDNGSSGAYYQYDAGGDRTYKLLYHKTTGSLNGVQTDYYTLDDATLYVSPYLVITPQGYTKHYYAESERITTQLGKSCFTGIDSCVAGYSLASIKLQEAVQVFPADSFPTPTPMLGYLHSLTNHPNTVSTLYFYHPDHLGSASWITNIYGRTIQHLYYLPWGEDFVNQRTGSFSSMYTFSAKEKDAETGYSYFGARYYSSDLSIWLSVDPMAAKYPSLSPYVYCADNPVRLVDPDGEEVCDGGDPSSKRLRRFYDYFDRKIRAPLMKMVEDGANDNDLEAAAAYLCNKYQKRLLKGYNRAVNGMGRIEKINVEVFSETEEKIEIDSRPDNQEMTVCGEIPIGANVYAVEIDFNPYGVENYATFIAANKVETGWINSPEGNSFSYDLEVDGAGSITYCIQNRLADKRHDNWSFSVTMRSRRLDIRPELRISNCRSRKKIVRKR